MEPAPEVPDNAFTRTVAAIGAIGAAVGCAALIVLFVFFCILGPIVGFAMAVFG